MKKVLASRLLSDLMQWDLAGADGDDFAWLDFMVDLKFDHYQGYTPGERFYVHLVHWLGQFTAAERKVAFREILRSRLIFVSQREVQHLVSLSYPIVRRQILANSAAKRGLKLHQVWTNQEARTASRLEELRTLYVALSDGARIDFFRRENEGIISNEQVVPSSEITRAKWGELKEKLAERLAAKGFGDEQPLFERICLIDDFTASGSTFARQVEGNWKGKLHKFCGPTKDLVPEFITPEAMIHVHHYLGSARADESIRQSVHDYAAQCTAFRFEVTFAHLLRPEDVIDDNAPGELVRLIQDHYDLTIEVKNPHLGNDVWYGYKQGGLCLVLDHNTPNNSIALLWAQDGEHPDLMRPLFPRKQRHVNHG